MKKLVIVGLGPGAWESLSLQALRWLKSGARVFLRTERHPLVSELQRQGISFQAFDYLYEEASSFEEVYQRMAAALLEEAAKQKEGMLPVVFAVPGHPLVAERVVQILLSRLRREEVEIVPGMSAVEAVCALLGIDPSSGLVIRDALTLEGSSIDPRLPMLILQVYNQRIASEVKLTLMEKYPDEWEIEVVKAAGVPGEERRERVLLYELDRLPWIDHLTSVYVPSFSSPRSEEAAFLSAASLPTSRYPLDPLVDAMERLLAPDGCPWDREQTHVSLRPYLIEEAYEVVEAIDEKDMDKLEEELGDLLLQVVFHAALARKHAYFDINDVILKVTQKMIHRHPHVFGEEKVRSSQEVLANWERIKRREGEARKKRNSYMEGIPRSLPALLRAAKVQAKASRLGFDWPDVEGAWEKIAEEVEELRQARLRGDREAMAEEIGDLLFAVVNVARFLKIDAEAALTNTVDKFVERFRYMEKRGAEVGKDLGDMSLEEMDALWDEAKNFQRKNL